MKIALFIDVDNYKINEREFAFLVNRLNMKGELVFGKVYNFSDRANKDLCSIIEQNGFEVAMMTFMNKKTKKSVFDLRVAVDAVKLCCKNNYIDAFCFAVGDGDIVALISMLKAEGKTVIGCFNMGNEANERVCNEVVLLNRESQMNHFNKKVNSINKKPAIKKPAVSTVSKSAEFIAIKELAIQAKPEKIIKQVELEPEIEIQYIPRKKIIKQVEVDMEEPETQLPKTEVKKEIKKPPETKEYVATKPWEKVEKKLEEVEKSKPKWMIDDEDIEEEYTPKKRSKDNAEEEYVPKNRKAKTDDVQSSNLNSNNSLKTPSENGDLARAIDTYDDEIDSNKNDEDEISQWNPTSGKYANNNDDNTEEIDEDNETEVDNKNYLYNLSSDENKKSTTAPQHRFNAQNLAAKLETFARRTASLNFDSGEDVEEKQILLEDIDKCLASDEFQGEKLTADEVESFDEIKSLVSSLRDTIKSSME